MLNIQLNIHRRFYSALALHDLVREMPLHAVCKKYGCSRGVLQTLQQSAATYAGKPNKANKLIMINSFFGQIFYSMYQSYLRYGHAVLQTIRLGLHGIIGESISNEIAIRRLQRITRFAAFADVKRLTSKKFV